MKLRFIGALGSVAGSCTLVNYNDHYYLVDCGISQGCEQSAAQETSSFDFKPTGITAVFLTHAHMDHCGMLPQLIREGFRGKIYCTRATADLTVHALRDAASLDGSAFSERDVERLEFVCPDDEAQFRFGAFVPLGANLTFSFIRTSHVLGSVAVEFQYAGGVNDPDRRSTIVFSGDLGSNTDGNCYQALLNARQYPSTYAQYVVCESTYGGRVRDSQYMNFDCRINALKQVILRAAKHVGTPTVIFPCFTLQRVQELITDLHHLFDVHMQSEELSSVVSDTKRPQILVDSPLAVKYGAVYARELSRVRGNGKSYYLNPNFSNRSSTDELPCGELIKQLLGSDSPYQRFKNFNLLKSPAVFNGVGGLRIVIAGAGMCNGGRVMNHLKRLLVESSTTVVISGYQSPRTPGSELMNRVENPSAELDGSAWGLANSEIRAEVVNLSPYYSGHADQQGLLDFLFAKNSHHDYRTIRRVFLVHGDNDARRSLKKAISMRSTCGSGRDRKIEQIDLPERTQQWFDLLQDKWVNECHSKVDDQSLALNTLMRRVEELERIVSALRLRAA